MAKCCNVTSKVVIVAINFLTWVVAAGFIFLGVWIFQEFAKYGKLVDTNEMSFLPACILLVVGVVLFLLGILGCVGAAKENRCVIGMYFSLLLAIFLLLAAGVGLAYVYHEKVETGLHDTMMDGFKKYNDNGTMNDVIDNMQTYMHCCGVDNYTDWMTLPWHDTHNDTRYPDSCCQMSKNLTTCSDANLYKQGCYTEMKEAFTGHIMAIFGVMVACFAVLAVGMVCACLLLRDRRNRNYVYRDLGDEDGMHV